MKCSITQKLVLILSEHNLYSQTQDTEEPHNFTLALAPVNVTSGLMVVGWLRERYFEQYIQNVIILYLLFYKLHLHLAKMSQIILYQPHVDLHILLHCCIVSNIMNIAYWRYCFPTNRHFYIVSKCSLLQTILQGASILLSLCTSVKVYLQSTY